MTPPAASTRSHTAWKWSLAGLALLGFVALTLAVDLPEVFRRMLDLIQRFGVWGPVLFIFAYVLATVCFAPASVLSVGAGAVFGVGWGSFYVSVAATLGASCAFWLGRHLMRDAMMRKFARDERFAAIDQAVAREGWKIVLLTRLSPVFPFNLLNYAFGLTGVKFGHYVFASWIGMMPGTVLYVYAGSVARAVAGERSRTTGEWVLYGVGLAATVVVTIFVTRLARRALAGRMDH